MTRFENTPRRERYETRKDQPVVNHTDQSHDGNHEDAQGAFHCFLCKPDTRIKPGPEEVRKDICGHHQDTSGKRASEY